MKYSFCKASEATFKYQGGNKKSESPRKLGKMYRKEPRSEIDYLIKSRQFVVIK